MSVVIKEVKNRRDLRRFVLFPEKLYKDNKYYVPPIVFNEMDTLDPKAIRLHRSVTQRFTLHTRTERL